MDTILGLPINRFVTFVKPQINALSGIVAAWLVAKINLLGIPGFDQSNVQTYVAAGVTLAAVTGLQQLGDLKWIKGHHIELANGGVQIADDTVDAATEDVLPPEVASGEIPVDDPSKVPPDQGDSGQVGAAQPDPTSGVVGSATITGPPGATVTGNTVGVPPQAPDAPQPPPA